MKKIAIVTIISRNYGNRLQNFALQETLKQMGVDVETIPMRLGKDSIKSNLKYMVKCFLNIVRNSYSDVVWEKFDKKIAWGNHIIGGDVEKIVNRYDFFVAGSDQIWNPLFDINTDRELLTFAPESKRVAYAASIGLEEFPQKYMKHYSKEWEKFRAISVREKQAADIVQKAIGKCPQVVLDPTMLLTKNDWRKVMKKTDHPGKFYVSYFLGADVEEYKEYIENYVQEKKCELVELVDIAGNVADAIGPAEFLGLLYDCQGVFTDSFHGTVFSLLFEKPFLVFERPAQSGYGDMNSRINTLLATFQLEKHKITNVEICKTAQMEWNHRSVEKILESERDKSKKFLLNAMDL